MKKHILFTLSLTLSITSFSQFSILDEQKISDLEGDFLATLDNGDIICVDIEGIGDLDLDGIPDVAISTTRDDDGGLDRGAVYITFLNANGTVKDYQKISSTDGGFGASLNDEDHFGGSLALLGDLNNDGVQDIAVGAYDDDDGGTKRGAVYILFLNTDGTVAGYQKISDTAGNFTATLDNNDEFGRGLAGIGDLNGDSVPDLAVGALLDDDGGQDRGALYILFMNTNGTVNSYQKISSTQGNFSGVLQSNGYFGFAVTNMGDINGDSVNDLAVTHRDADVNGFDKGEVYILFMNQNGTVNAHQRITEGSGGLNATLSNGERFGYSVQNIDDINNDGVNDLLVGSPYSSEGGFERGRFAILYLTNQGLVGGEQWFSSIQGGVSGPIDNGDLFGYSVANLGDINSDSHNDIMIGAVLDDDGGTDKGAGYIFFQRNTLSISENNKNGVVCVQPNPFSNNFEIANSSDKTQVIEIIIYSADGRKVFNQNNVKTQFTSINTANWLSGSYVVSIKLSSGEIVRQSIIKI